MRRLLFIISLFILWFSLMSTEYWFSSTGSDSNSGTLLSPWLHINNHSYSTGDTLYIEAGYIMDSVNLKMLSLDNVLITYYGDGDQPILSGAIPITNFTQLNDSIWWRIIDTQFPRGSEVHTPNGITQDHIWQECVSCDSLIRVARANSDINTVKFYYAGGFATNELAGTYLSGMPRPWQWNTQKVFSNTSNTCELVDDLGYSFFQSDTNSERWCTIFNNYDDLDADLNWRFADDTLWIHSTANPNDRNIRFTLSDTVVYLNNCDNFRMRGVTLEQSNWSLLYSEGGTGMHIDTCQFNASSGYGIYSDDTDTTHIYDNLYTDILCHSLYIYVPDSGLVRGNYFLRSGITNGMANYVYGGSGNHGGAIKLQGLRENGNYQIKYNIFNYVGLATQIFTSFNSTTQDFYANLIMNYGGELGDNAGYYSASQVYTTNTSRTVRNNIFINGTSFLYGKQSYGTSPGYYTHAIYYDEDDLIEVSDSNSIDSTCVAFYHNRRNRHTARWNNVIFADSYVNLHNDHYNSIWFSDQSIGSSTQSADRDSIKYNKIVLGGESNATAYLRHTTTAQIGLGYDNNNIYSDYNKIAYPWGTYTNVAKYTLDYGSSSSNYSLAQMQANTDNFNANTSDANTTQHMHNDYSGKSYLGDEYLIMLKNFSPNTHVFDLDESNTYRNIDSTQITITQSVKPFYSEILFKQEGSVIDEQLYIEPGLVYFYDLLTDRVIGNVEPLLNTIKQQPFRKGLPIGFYRNNGDL